MINRIQWLENLIEKANKYIKQLEKERQKLLDDYWKYFEAWKREKQKRKELELKNKTLKNENKALKLLLKDLYFELEDFERKQKRAQQRIDENIKIQNLFFNQIQNNVKQFKKEIKQPKTLKELREKVKEVIQNEFKIYA